MSLSPAESAPTLYNVKLQLPADLDDSVIGRIALCLEDIALATVMARADNDHRGPWTISWIVNQTYELPFIESIFQTGMTLRGLSLDLVSAGVWLVEPVPDVNWLEHSYQQFEPFCVSDFYIYGSHFDGTPPADKIPLQIDAATAFGSGEHGTTAGCLKALLTLRDQGLSPRHVLDMGTGSGILAVAAARLWPAAPIMAVDIEEEAVRVTQHHAAINDVAAAVTALHGDGFATAAVQEAQPFDLVIANILAGPLVSMAPALSACLDARGYAILSGMLVDQTDDVSAAYKALGFTVAQRYDEKDWTALLLQKA